MATEQTNSEIEIPVIVAGVVYAATLISLIALIACGVVNVDSFG